MAQKIGNEMPIASLKLISEIKYATEHTATASSRIITGREYQRVLSKHRMNVTR